MKIKNFTLLALLTIGSLFAVGPDDPYHINEETPCKLTLEPREPRYGPVYLVRFTGVKALLSKAEPLGPEVNTNSILGEVINMGFLLHGLRLDGEGRPWETDAVMSGYRNWPEINMEVLKLLTVIMKSYRENHLSNDSVDLCPNHIP